MLVLAPLLVLGGIAAWVAWQVDPPGGPGKPVEVTVRKGWGVADIGDALDHSHVIGSSLVFQAYVKVTGAGPFQAGTYDLHEHLGARAAAAALEKGPHITYATLRAIPGLRLSEIAALVGKLPGRSAARFLAAARSGRVRSRFEPAGTNDLEGLLFPDTYEFAPWEDETAIVRTMVRRFDQVASSIGLAHESVPGVTPYQVVEVASIVQSEAKLDVDRPLIASVVYNRLRRGMKLQIDATVLYAIGQRKASNTAADRAVDSPYNTYRVTGLPPTPISSVTKASLLAAMHPADTPYLYYVLANADGKHAFAATYQEHLRNVEEARRKGLLQ